MERVAPSGRRAKASQMATTSRQAQPVEVDTRGVCHRAKVPPAVEQFE